MATTKKYPMLTQSRDALRRSAELANVATQKTAPAPRVSGANASATPRSVPPTNPQDLWLSFFFDGTGNNLDADLGQSEHSNVARLYLAHETNAPSKGVFRIYIPGLGTRFREIGDPGGGILGPGFGARGEARLDWAMRQLEKSIKSSTGKFRSIQVALFGFSRGATLARAFARMLFKRSEKTADGWRLIQERHPISVYFMGLFDTVASVGMATSANNGGALGVLSARLAMAGRGSPQAPNSPWNIAAGEARGADPSSGALDGHGSWADDLRIPPIVEQCVHLVAAHEIRNSFPLDSILQGHFYRDGCVEIVLPGAHSDVGGGYRQGPWDEKRREYLWGEGARSKGPGSLLSLIPLRMMRDTALMAGVPLRLKLEKQDLTDFGMDPACAKDFGTLVDRFNHYIKAMGGVGGGNSESLGQQMLAHLKLYYQWRFYKLAQNMMARMVGLPTNDEARLHASEPFWAEEQKQQKARLDALEDKADQHRNQARMFRGAGMDKAPLSKGQLDAMKELQALADEQLQKYLEAKALYDTMPGADSSMEKSLRLYDEQLLADARLLKRISKTRKLRPHYRALLEAFEAEFEKGKGLRDEKIIAFFDCYVHDSLAGFAGDATLPSDPRVIYIGDDDKLRFAVNQSTRASVADLA